MKKLILLLLFFPGMLCAREVSVDNPLDLFNAIAPNTTIILAPGDYNFSVLDENASTDYAKFSYGELIITGVRNLTLRGEGYAECGTEDPYSNVFRFVQCEGIILDNLVMGHFIEKGYCEGSVLSFDQSSSIEVKNSVMYGSGTYGIQAFGVEGLEVTDCVVKDCSYGTLFLSDVKNVEFRNTQFKRCQSGIAIQGSSKLILFSDCYFTGIKDYQEWAKWNKDAQFLFSFGDEVESVLLKNNRFDRNSTKDLLSSDSAVTVKGSTGTGNTFNLD